jgi:D-amino-acid dehydrogenase
MKVVVLGGGVIGLSSAYYLQEAGHQVTVIDQSDILNNCSYGNAGYVCPSHFIPLATPGETRIKVDVKSTKPLLC